MPATPEPSDRRSSWQALLRDAAEPLFLLNRRRRLLYANPAWEKLTGLALSEARGQACRRRSARSEPGQQTLALLAPPPEALAGQPCSVRRRAPGAAGVVWWDIAFFPWGGGDGPAAILGKIRPVAAPGPAHAALPEKLMQLRQRDSQEYRLENLAGDGPLMQRLAEQVRLAAATALPVWIQGPPGSGKEWLARAIHHAAPRREAYFAGIAADRLPAGALAELLHEAPRRWHIGTLYVKNPERLPREVQTLLLQALDAGEEAPRIIAGSSAVATSEIREGRLLPELHCRLSALSLQVPALIERLEDMPRLLERLLPRAREAAGGNAGASVTGVAAETIELLRLHGWPGNLTELYEVLLSACGRATGERLEPGDLPFYLQQAPLPAEQPLPLDEVLEKVERRLIALALKLSQDNKTRAAELLAIWRPRLVRRMGQLGMDV
jgi:DNA-binding NtrC family response regulator